LSIWVIWSFILGFRVSEFLYKKKHEMRLADWGKPPTEKTQKPKKKISPGLDGLLPFCSCKTREQKNKEF
jgi:hypothetical protein